MKIVLDVNDCSKIIQPNTNAIVLYDGKKWYVTTKQNIFSEYEDKIVKLNTAYEKLVEENKQFKSAVSKQINEMADLIQNLYSGKGE